MQHINFYRGRVAINVLACDLENAREVYDASEGHAVIGVLSSQFADVGQGVQEVEPWTSFIPAISVGLGAGDPTQYAKAALIAAATRSAHVNQTFTGAGFAAGALAGNAHTCINALVSPSGQPGRVIISTGERSGQQQPILADCDSAVCMMLDMGAHAAKFFPMGGEKSLAELKALAESAVRQGMTMIEPTGGIDLANFSVILETCLRAGVPKVMPHIYSSIIDKQSGRTRPEDVANLMQQVKALLS